MGKYLSRNCQSSLKHVHLMTNIAFTIWPFIYFWKKEISSILYRDLQENQCQYELQ